MAWFVGQSAVMIGLAFLLGLLVGWLLWGLRGRSQAAEGVTPVSPAGPQLPPAPVIKLPVAEDERDAGRE
jgi:hypothetical protein